MSIIGLIFLILLTFCRVLFIYCIDTNCAFVYKPLHENKWCNEEGQLGLMYYPVINPHTYLLGVKGVST